MKILPASMKTPTNSKDCSESRIILQFLYRLPSLLLVDFAVPSAHPSLDARKIRVNVRVLVGFQYDTAHISGPHAGSCERFQG